MGYPHLRACLTDLERTRQLVRVEAELDPRLEVAAVHRRVSRAGGPALLFTRPRGCAFPLVSNLFGTVERTRFLFRDTLATVEMMVALKGDPAAILRHPWRGRGLPRAVWNLRPKFVRRGDVMACETAVSRLPHVTCWPLDGGPFVTLPLVYTEDPARPGWRHGNLGMYRVQLAGNEYEPDREVGLHYQIHRGIGVHHAAAIRAGVPLRVAVAVGGPPALALAAVMPLPEGFPELAFAGALGGRRVRLAAGPGGLPVPSDADFVLCGTIDPGRLKPEGPFGDHLGYYALTHPFPVMRVEKVYHRADAVWPFTVVGRPPQEDSAFGAFIHELTGPAIPAVIPGVHGVHAVDAAGVHPLLLAIGSERYVPYACERKPMELLTAANAILGQGQLSLAKYLLIAAREDDPNLDVADVAGVLRHALERLDPTRDLHFQTATTMDTLDYSGSGLNEGSKVVIAAAGPKRRELPAALPPGGELPEGFADARICGPGILAVRGPSFAAEPKAVRRFCEAAGPALQPFPLITVVDDSDFCARNLDAWLWVTFTRSNPAADIDGVDAFVHDKHWGCRGPVVIDARIKPHHAPAVQEDADVEKRIDALAARGGPLHGLV
jgi:4-hydroxy-3-polyprenylbenzoate decarboxylase